LPKSQLERIHEGGDEYLMKMCQNWEIQQREREKEKERERTIRGERSGHAPRHTHDQGESI